MQAWGLRRVHARLEHPHTDACTCMRHPGQCPNSAFYCPAALHSILHGYLRGRHDHAALIYLGPRLSSKQACTCMSIRAQLHAHACTPRLLPVITCKRTFCLRCALMLCTGATCAEHTTMQVRLTLGRGSHSTPRYPWASVKPLRRQLRRVRQLRCCRRWRRVQRVQQRCCWGWC